jgi:HK97 family phage major capsid protein
MKKSLELKESRSALVETLESIKNTAEGESRNLNEAETIEVDNTLSSIDTLDTQIERAERVEKELRTAASISGVKVTPTQDKDLGKFTFQGAVRAAYSGKVEGIYKEMHDEAINESRYTGTTIKGYGIPASVLTRAWSTASVNNEEVMSFTDQLEKNLVLSSAGANTYFGINDMKFPVFSGISSTWVSEDGSSGAASSAGNLSAVTLTPKKLISVVNMTSESMMQNPSLEANLQRNMAQQLAAALEYAVLDTGDVSNAPESIFADATAGPTAVTAADWVEMETDALALGVQREGARMAYLLDMDAYKTVKTLAQVASVSPIWDNGDRRLNGYYAFQSGNVAASGTSAKAHALFGDFSKVHIAQFGGLDILFDPYTEAAKGLPRMVVTSLVDADATQNDSFIKLIEA